MSKGPNVLSLVETWRDHNALGRLREPRLGEIPHETPSNPHSAPAEAQLPRAAECEPGLEGKPRSKPRILLVDDAHLVRRALKQLLEVAGYQVSEAASGNAALRSLETAKVDLLITDLIMPDGDGLETIRSVHRDRPDLPVIAMSGTPDPNYLRMAKFLGAHSTLAKPITAELLLAEIRRLLSGK